MQKNSPLGIVSSHSSEVGQNFTTIVKFWKNSYFQITGPYPKVIGNKDSPNHVVSGYIIKTWITQLFGIEI